MPDEGIVGKCPAERIRKLQFIASIKPDNKTVFLPMFVLCKYRIIIRTYLSISLPWGNNNLLDRRSSASVQTFALLANDIQLCHLSQSVSSSKQKQCNERVNKWSVEGVHSANPNQTCAWKTSTRTYFRK